MTYEELVVRVRELYENADAREVFEHVAIQINLEGEVTGAFYIEVANREVCVEPYTYYDRDILVTLNSGLLEDILDGRVKYKDAVEGGLISIKGDLYKYELMKKIKLRSRRKTRASKKANG